MDEMIGVIKMFAGNFAPQGFLFCQGQQLPIQQYQALYSILGTTYGGDGSSYFNLPNLSGRFPQGAGQGAGLSPARLGELEGRESVTLLETNLPPHSHATTVNAYKETGSSPDPTGKLWSNTAGTDPDYRADGTMVALDSKAVSVKLTGGGQPFSIIPPSLTINFIICVNGIYPSRP